MEVFISYSDILRLFKARFGGVLNSSLIENEGFTMSPEFVKAALRTVKLTDLTLGDLAAMSGDDAPVETGEAENNKDASNVKPFPLKRV